MDTKAVDRGANINEIDATVRNKFRWEWLSDQDPNGDFYSDYVRKIGKAGYVVCKWCDKQINHGVAGKKGLSDHSKSIKHKKKRNLIRSNQSLPSVLSATRAALDMPQDNSGSATEDHRIPYGAAPNIPGPSGYSDTAEVRPNVNFLDRKAYAEARTLAFISEHSLPLSMVPHLIDYAKEMASDPKALNAINMERTTA